jgi:ADP-ribose pyrophosphatase
MRPWKKINSEYVVADRWLQVTADRCELPNGIVLDPYYVIHEQDWVHVFALDHCSRLLVVRQYRYAADTICLELPGGVIDQGEDPLTAAKRELLEETGYTSNDWLQVGRMFANPARQTNRIHVFIARHVSATHVQRLDASEDIAFELLPLAVVQDAIAHGEFSQALHVASFFRCLQHELAFGGAGAAVSREDLNRPQKPDRPQKPSKGEQ